MELQHISDQTRQAVEELLSVAQMKPGQILVVGCSTSEVSGTKIGTAGSLEVAEAILKPLLEVTRRAGLYLAIQCCEHLNRALVVEEEVMEKYNLEQVSAYPIRKAGGSLAAKAMDLFGKPVLVETIAAHAGLDIGHTLIGMHLKRVAVPVRLKVTHIGEAPLVAARTRPKLIGGARAVYEKPCD